MKKPYWTVSGPKHRKAVPGYGPAETYWDIVYHANGTTKIVDERATEGAAQKRVDQLNGGSKGTRVLGGRVVRS